MWFLVPSISTELSNIEVRAESITVVYKLACFSSYSRNATSIPLKSKIRNFSEEVSSLYHISQVISIRHFPKIVLLHSLRVQQLKPAALSAFFQLRKNARNAVTQRKNFVPFLPNHVINNLSIFFSSLFFFLFHFLTNSSRIFFSQGHKIAGSGYFPSYF